MARRRSRGALEAAVMRVLWNAEGPLSAREIGRRVGAGTDARADDGTGEDAELGAPALTTVLTVLERLRLKHLVTKTPTPGGHAFAAASSESGVTADAMVQALLAATDRDAALLRFASRLDGRDLHVLRRALDGPHGDDGVAASPPDHRPGEPG